MWAKETITDLNGPQKEEREFEHFIFHDDRDDIDYDDDDDDDDDDTAHCISKLRCRAISPTLARPAAPLATGVIKLSSVDKTNMATSLEGSKD